MNNLSDLDLEFIKGRYEEYKGLSPSEENIKNHVVVKFLEMLGYDPMEVFYEYSKFHKDGRADMAIKVDSINYLYVEVKGVYKKLDEKSQSQLAEYLFERNLSWGILTNGRNFILINNDIKGNPTPNRPFNNLDRIVFNIDIYNQKDEELIKYFSKENLFDNKISNYFKDIAQFKAYKFPDGGGSWATYRGTLFNFFKYYADIAKKYRQLSHIRIDEFEDYLRYDWEKKSSDRKKVSSKQTFVNKYSHIRSFFQTLKVNAPGFDLEREEFIKRYNFEAEEGNEKEILNEDSIGLILDFYNNRRDNLRNKTVFLLCLSFGLERSTLRDLTYDSLKGNKLTIGNRVLTLPPKLKILFDELIKENKIKKIKGNNLFYTKYLNKHKPISASGVNYIFDILQEIDTSWNKLSPAYVRSYIIRELFKKNYPLEEIMYLTGADFSSISHIITYDDLVEQVKTRKKKDKKIHPFHDFLY